MTPPHHASETRRARLRRARTGLGLTAVLLVSGSLIACSGSNGPENPPANPGPGAGGGTSVAGGPSAGQNSGTGAQPGTGTEPSCLTTRQFFAQEVWPKVMVSKCINCHAPGGLAAEQNSALLLYPTSYPGFLDLGLDSMRELAKTQYEGVSVLLQKPAGRVKHGGGVQLEADSAEYALLGQLIERLNSGETCQAGDAEAPVAGLTLAAPAQTFRKASLLLAGRLPTKDELARLETEGEAALGTMLDGLMNEPAFKSWLLVAFNDVFLTDRYLGDSTNTLRKEDFPNIDVYLTDTTTDEDKKKYRRSVAREPLELIAYIVQQNRPFTEILTADYTMLNGFSAQIYNETSLTFTNPADENEFKPGKIHALRSGVDLVFPHAGVLSSPMFLNRFPTTPTNRNRHRAANILEKFLATDILKFGDRPIDPTQAVAFTNPTREDPACSVCHALLDPIAGAFMGFSDNDAEQLVPNREWFKEMFLPGFGEETMQTSDYPRALPWLASRVAEDPRFPRAMLLIAYRALTSREPLAYPQSGDPQALAGWDHQNQAFDAIAQRFVAANHDFKVLLRELMLSPYFRGENAQDGAAAAALEPYGATRLSTPEALTRKLRAAVGFDWVRYDRQPMLTTTMNILYGGIDSDGVTERLGDPNGTMSAVMSRMANEVACQATAWDFNKPKDQRLLFPHVEVSDIGEASDTAIRANLRYLHSRLLGEELDDTSPELERSYTLFRETLAEGTQKLADKSLSNSLPWNCRGRWDRLTGTELPEGQRLEEDKNYAIRSWMAVMTYLLLDSRFLYE